MESHKNTSPALSGNRMLMQIAGNLLIGIGVAFYRLSLFGTDAYSCMNLGISGFLGLSFGTWQLMMNIFILAIVFFTIRSFIGLGTIVNMVFVGYIADFLCWLVWDVLGIEAALALRLLYLCAGTLFATLGCALYISADMGISPYDCVAFIITKYTGERISFRAARILSDVTVILAGITFCLLAHNNLWNIVGFGTVVNACCSGPLIQFFRTKITETQKAAV